MFASTFASRLRPLQKMRMSSTKCKCVILKLVVSCIPRKSPYLTKIAIALLSPSTTNKKSRGERVHPWCSPFSEVKKVEATPFMMTVKETKEM
jgi:hypothetical protein